MNPRTSILIVSVLLALLSGCSKQDQVAAASQVDLILTHGAIYTSDQNRSLQQAIAIQGDRIVYVGTDQGAKAYTGPNTRVINLMGRMVLPGLQDVHIHPILGGIEAAACDLNGLTTADQYIEMIKAYAEANPDLPWITGGGWLTSAFGPGAMPRKEMLDAVVPGRPVLLHSSDGHSAWANSLALKLAGITRETPDPEDGRIDRIPKTGELVGSLQEGATSLLDHVLPPITDQQRQDGLRFAIRMLNGYGITSIQDAIVDEDALRTYQALDESGELTLKVEGSQWWERTEGLEQIAGMIERREKYGKGHLRANTVKFMLDGVMENYTAVMLEPYLIPGEVRGIPMLDAEVLKQAVTAIDEAGFQAHFHAVGDGAVRQSLDAVEAARKANGPGDNRHHISHLELIDPQDIPRFGELDVIANFQPLWATSDAYITELTIPFIGAERARWLYPISSVLQNGGMIAFGSDWSVSTANPFYEIEVAVTRKDPETGDADVLIPEERIVLEDAIAAFTINAAYTNHLDEQTGSIEVGKQADLVVLDQNLFEVAPEAISATKVLLTLFEGKQVYGDLS
ncbi:MAG: amidohydrolase, partial [Gammaproteobacteria bacterium]|nr:amidohydrolase [Gammaproteobacteria bacterium]